MFEKTLEFLQGKSVGIVGAGRLGKAMARSLLNCGFPKEQVLISCRGSPATLQALQQHGLSSIVETDNQKLFDRCKILLLMIRAQDVMSLKGLKLCEGTRVLSFLPGVSLSTLRTLFDTNNVSVGQTCSPDIMLAKKGLIAMYPAMQEEEEQLFTGVGMSIFPLPREELLHVYGTSMCLGAALCMCDKKKTKHSVEDARELTNQYDGLNYVALYNWATSVKPDFDSDEERDTWMINHCTKGGLTEAIIEEIEQGGSFLDGIRAGIQRSKELAKKTQISPDT